MLNNRPSSYLFGFWLILALVLLSACSKGNDTYVGEDITGTSYGKDFRLSDPDGRERTLADFRGKYVLMFFGFAQCPTVCPTFLALATEVRKRLGADGEKLQVIFVTLDPERDTSEVMREYTKAFDPSFIGLRGDLESTRKVANEFRVYYQKVPTDGSYTIDHSAFAYLLDPEGHPRLMFSNVQSVEDYLSDIHTLINSASSSNKGKQ